MVAVPPIAGRAAFCIDRYEASLDGTTAVSQRFVLPARGVTWDQATTACANAGKRLCTADEWQTACRGESDRTYPYGDAWQPGTCNGFDATRGDVVETGGMIFGDQNASGTLEAQGCVSTLGAYDMSGNVWEWNATQFLGTRRGIAGGGFRSNRIGLRCVTAETHALPDEQNDAFGFRCCRDAM
jgi:formylglycine-generating enzyme required for sulfatase activity